VEKAGAQEEKKSAKGRPATSKKKIEESSKFQNAST